ncbi:hypothetical protein TrST_g10948 [Triparma strigata]|uniref:RRM domain-containing protein n=1 Tax=Triparma strigata TaxID=1606541 RepID=A0A9W7EXZ2_9STRA|nr:hypothetical protein TrST_g10948 [Triparma strigata]
MNVVRGEKYNGAIPDSVSLPSQPHVTFLQKEMEDLKIENRRLKRKVDTLKGLVKDAENEKKKLKKKLKGKLKGKKGKGLRKASLSSSDSSDGSDSSDSDASSKSQRNERKRSRTKDSDSKSGVKRSRHRGRDREREREYSDPHDRDLRRLSSSHERDRNARDRYRQRSHSRGREYHSPEPYGGQDRRCGDRDRDSVTDNSNPRDRIIYVRGLPFEANEAGVFDYFIGCGDIECCKLEYSAPEKCSGVARLMFRTLNGAERALALHGAIYGKRWLEIRRDPNHNFAHKPLASPVNSAPPPSLIDTAFFANFAPETSQDDMFKFFDSVAPVDSVRLPRDAQTDESKGYGFVKLKAAEDLYKIVALDGTDINGLPIHIEYSSSTSKQQKFVPAVGVYGPRSDYKPPPIRNVRTPGSTTVYVGNLNPAVTDREVTDFFDRCGSIVLFKRMDNGGGSQFGFVVFKEEAAVDAAMDLDGSFLMGSKVKVGYAKGYKTSGWGPSCYGPS